MRACGCAGNVKRQMPSTVPTTAAPAAPGAPLHAIIEDSCTHYGFQPTCVTKASSPGHRLLRTVFRTLAQERTQQMSGGTGTSRSIDGVARVSMASGRPCRGTHVVWPLSPVTPKHYSARLDAAGIASWSRRGKGVGSGTAPVRIRRRVARMLRYKLDDDLVFSAMRDVPSLTATPLTDGPRTAQSPRSTLTVNGGRRRRIVIHRPRGVRARNISTGRAKKPNVGSLRRSGGAMDALSARSGSADDIFGTAASRSLSVTRRPEL